MERAREDWQKLKLMEAANKRQELEESAARARAETAEFDPEKAAAPSGTFGDFEIEDKIRKMEEQEQERIAELQKKIQLMPDVDDDAAWSKAKAAAEKKIALADNPEGIEPVETPTMAQKMEIDEDMIEDAA